MSNFVLIVLLAIASTAYGIGELSTKVGYDYDANLHHCALPQSMRIPCERDYESQYWTEGSCTAKGCCYEYVPSWEYYFCYKGNGGREQLKFMIEKGYNYMGKVAGGQAANSFANLFLLAQDKNIPDKTVFTLLLRDTLDESNLLTNAYIRNSMAEIFGPEFIVYDLLKKPTDKFVPANAPNTAQKHKFGKDGLLKSYCVVDPLDRVQCGNRYVTEDRCVYGFGCCFDKQQQFCYKRMYNIIKMNCPPGFTNPPQCNKKAPAPVVLKTVVTVGAAWTSDLSNSNSAAFKALQAAVQADLQQKAGSRVVIKVVGFKQASAYPTGRAGGAATAATALVIVPGATDTAAATQIVANDYDPSKGGSLVPRVPLATSAVTPGSECSLVTCPANSSCQIEQGPVCNCNSGYINVSNFNTDCQLEEGSGYNV